jgi:hypothetical protein
MSSQKWKISLAKQGKFKIGVDPADGLHRPFTTKNFFVIIKWSNLAMSFGIFG